MTRTKLRDASADIQESRVKGSNLPHYAGILHAATTFIGVTHILKRYLTTDGESIVVDVIAGSNNIWVKVVARNPRALHSIWTGSGQYGERNIVQRANQYLECAKQHAEFYRPPRVYFCFYGGITQLLASELASLGVVVIGDVIVMDESSSNGSNERDKNAYELDLADSCQRDMCGEAHGQSGQICKRCEATQLHINRGSEACGINNQVRSLFALSEIGCGVSLANEPGTNNEVNFEVCEQGQGAQTVNFRNAFSNAYSFPSGALSMNLIYEDSRLAPLDEGVRRVIGDCHAKNCFGMQAGDVDTVLTELHPMEVEVKGKKYQCEDPIEKQDPSLCGLRVNKDESCHSEKFDSSLTDDCEKIVVKGSSTNKNAYSKKHVEDPKREVCIPACRERCKTQKLDCILSTLFNDSRMSARIKEVTKEMPAYYAAVLPNIGNNLHVNLDITTLVGLVSALSHGRCYFTFHEKVLTSQATDEQSNSLLKKLEPFLTGRQLFVCQTAWKDFSKILATLGGENEARRSRDLETQLTVVPDVMSDRVHKLAESARINRRSKVIFGTGDHEGLITVTANGGFVRAACKQGVELAVFVHQARALTELKEYTATPSV